MKKILSILLYFVAFALPVYLFEIMFRSQLSELELNSGGIYRDAPFFYIPISVILVLLFSWLSTRFGEKMLFRIIASIVYALFYMWMCFFIAYAYKQLFGTTWQRGEVFSALVLSQWYFYVFGSVGIIIFSLPLIQKKQKLRHIQAIHFLKRRL